MPPSSRSSSSHSSHSSSSHSSSSRSSFHSSPSSRSSSSHSSHSSSGRSFSGRTTPVYRTRANQPQGYSGQTSHPIHCINHDYVFYAADWDNAGTHYRAGYYDENGTYYPGIAIKDQTTTCRCSYCDTMTKITWDGGALPSCPNCGAPMGLTSDTVDTSYPASGYGTRSVDSSTAFKSMLKVFGILFAALMIFMIAAIVIGNAWMDKEMNSGYETSIASTAALAPESFYAEPIGRTCHMDSNGFYYDKQTGCYFVFNDWLDPAQWQYWFEGIGEDYGDYGWMEYEDSTQQWYIETGEDEWVPLPDTYDTSKLWHFDDAYKSGF